MSHLPGVLFFWKDLERPIDMILLQSDQSKSFGKEEHLCYWEIRLTGIAEDIILSFSLTLRFSSNQYSFTTQTMKEEMSSLRAYICCLIEHTIGSYRTAIESRKEPEKNIENVLFRKTEICHYLCGQSAVLKPTNRRTSNFEVVSDDVASSQLWSSLTRISLGTVARETGIDHESSPYLTADIFEPMILLCLEACGSMDLFEDSSLILSWER
ncbi:hypothetical protein PHYBLDRAFT_176161 [Phycomyces blakesleeanus NRRL 1555(-)]|uniref:Uncharacterized protein n=1 Tax=Phycomyces blakesleeanus (strain ATCC 8743b / DSM 1359 / FGSC 10004 / NBRC 33097 / NRRL 1555) TaxID=763407 RepID=A0A162N362_PHYB8|nr:hypothetical protein PHYBLDRAFT_176161 [Phycomyces blakesleeanus NRRL 1555(-)]OAD65394.1 hypothetical protein PHYBLDRAFT_176161 [Phycomyces blakesleeanus NRRL 1555(-)]|eukprot:XP_018283434.1 hypothetical protein PHYBLDRAFT_176161 [Phycomyces blakesleeanus NRRL 1555(-)]